MRSEDVSAPVWTTIIECIAEFILRCALPAMLCLPWRPTYQRKTRALLLSDARILRAVRNAGKREEERMGKETLQEGKSGAERQGGRQRVRGRLIQRIQCRFGTLN